MNDRAMESRQAGSAYGKCERRIDVSVPEEVCDIMIALARQAGMPTAEYARLVFERHCFGAAPQIKRRDPLMG